MAKIIGICGPSGSGKSTIAQLIADKYDANVIGLDNYFLLDTPHKKYGEQGKDLELPENTDWGAINDLIDSVHSETPEITVQRVSWKDSTNIKYTLENKDVTIVEGFLLFHDQKLVDKLDLAVYIDISDTIGLKRRMEREGTEENKIWFEEVTFPEYQKRREVFKNRADLVLNGEKSLEENLQILTKEIELLH